MEAHLVEQGAVGPLPDPDGAGGEGADEGAVEARFGVVPLGLERKIKGIEDLGALKVLLRKVILAPSLEDVEGLPELR